MKDYPDNNKDKQEKEDLEIAMNEMLRLTAETLNNM